MWTYTHTDELYHYGIPGMKWGHRKSYSSGGGKPRGRKQSQSIFKRKKRPVSLDSYRATKIRKKKISQMSNEQLKTVNKRLELENKYNDLTSKRKIGKKVVTGFITTAATIASIKVAANTYKEVAGWAAEKLADRVIE